VGDVTQSVNKNCPQSVNMRNLKSDEDMAHFPSTD